MSEKQFILGQHKDSQEGYQDKKMLKKLTLNTQFHN